MSELVFKSANVFTCSTVESKFYLSVSESLETLGVDKFPAVSLSAAIWRTQEILPSLILLNPDQFESVSESLKCSLGRSQIVCHYYSGKVSVTIHEWNLSNVEESHKWLLSQIHYRRSSLSMMDYVDQKIEQSTFLYYGTCIWWHCISYCDNTVSRVIFQCSWKCISQSEK